VKILFEFTHHPSHLLIQFEIDGVIQKF